MKKILLLSFFACFLILSCKKSSTPNNNPYSSWYVNNQKFTTNDILITNGKVAYTFDTKSNYNGFRFGFNLPGYLGDSSFKLDCSLFDPHWACFNLLYSGVNYSPLGTKQTYITSKLQLDSTVAFNLDTCWLYSSVNNQDSILVYGTFVQPKSLH